MGRWAAGLRGLVPTLPRSVWWTLGADALSAAGSGLTVPFLMVYLHAVRGLGLGVSGAAAATVALAGLAGNPLGGAGADRFGPRRVLALGWALAATGAAVIALVSTVWQAFAAAAVSGLGAALAWPALDTLLAQLAPPEQRSGVFALRHATMNTGLAVGGLASAVIADTARPSSFELLYGVDAASFLAAICLLCLVRAAPRPAADGQPEPQPPGGDEGDAATPSGGYRAVWRDQVFVRLWVLIAILVAAGFAQLTAILPVLIVSAGVGASVVGLCFAANTVTVSACQLLVLKLARGRRRTRAVAVLGGLWALSWLLVLTGGRLGAGLGAVLFVAAAVVFGLGETLFAPSLPPLVNDIAPEALRGRYNGASAFAYTTGFALGPALAGLLLQHHQAIGLLLSLTLACATAGALAASVRRRLPAGTDLIDPLPSADGTSATDGAAEAREARA